MSQLKSGKTTISPTRLPKHLKYFQRDEDPQYKNGVLDNLNAIVVTIYENVLYCHIYLKIKTIVSKTPKYLQLEERHHGCSS